MSDTKKIIFECRCGKQAQLFTGLYQTEDNELHVVWRCSRCKKDCMAIVAGMKPVLPFYTDYDTGFLKSCRTYIKEDSQCYGKSESQSFSFRSVLDMEVTMPAGRPQEKSKVCNFCYLTFGSAEPVVKMHNQNFHQSCFVKHLQQEVYKREEKK